MAQRLQSIGIRGGDTAKLVYVAVDLRFLGFAFALQAFSLVVAYSVSSRA